MHAAPVADGDSWKRHVRIVEPGALHVRRCARRLIFFPNLHARVARASHSHQDDPQPEKSEKDAILNQVSYHQYSYCLDVTFSL